MGRKKIAKELRKINVCITISPTIWDMLDEMADSQELNQSAFITMLINDYYDEWIKIANGNYTRKPFDGAVIE